MQPFDRQHTRCISNLSEMEVVHNLSNFTGISNAFEFSGANKLLPIANEKDFDIMFYDCSTLKLDKQRQQRQQRPIENVKTTIIKHGGQEQPIKKVKNTNLIDYKQIESNDHDISTHKNYIKNKNTHQKNGGEETSKYKGFSSSTPKMTKKLPSLPPDVTSFPCGFMLRDCKTQNIVQNTSKKGNPIIIPIIINDEYFLPSHDNQHVINQNCNEKLTNNCFPLKYKTKPNCNRYDNIRGFSSSPELQSNLEKDLSNDKLRSFSETKKKNSFPNEMFDLKTSSVVQTKMENLAVPSFINGLSDNESEATDDLDDSRHLIEARKDVNHVESKQNNKKKKKKKRSIKLFRNLTDPVRFLPKTPKSSTGELKRKSLWRTNSEPISFTKDKKTEKHRSFYYELKSHFSKKAKQEEKNVEEEDLTFGVFEQKKYNNALLRGRRGAVFSLEINQSISIIQTFPQQNKYSQFKFMSQNSSSIQNS